MTLLTRSTLKNLFKRGAVPSEVNFSDLIDSTVNKVDDGFAQSHEHGFMLAPQGKRKKLMSFFESIRDPNSAISMSLSPDRSSRGVSVDDANDNTILFLRDNGNIGVGTTTPNFRLQVDGMAGVAGRIGTFASGEVKANGEWQTIVDGLEKIQAFEMVAHAAGPKNRGKYAFTHATGVCVYGSGSIRHTRSTFKKIWGRLWHRISFRFEGDQTGYKLQVRTFSNYGFKNGKNGEMCKIHYNVSKLWDDTMIPEGPENVRL